MPARRSGAISSVGLNETNKRINPYLSAEAETNKRPQGMPTGN